MHRPVTRASASILNAAVKHWASLSHSYPLDFALKSADHATHQSTYDHALSAYSTAMLRILANEAYRWQSASLTMGPHLTEVFCDIVLNHSTSRSFPILKCLDIILLHERPGAVDEVTRAIGSIKSLTELTISLLSNNERMSLLLMHMPWSQLTSVRFNMDVTVDQAASLLAHATAAVTATFANIMIADHSNHRGKSCTHPKLKQLSVNGDRTLSDLFNRFNFPCLEQLDFSSNPLECNQVVHWLLERPTIPIRRLELLSYRPFSNFHLANWLRSQRLREVSHVELHSSDILNLIAGAVAQLKNDIPVMWSWRTPQGEDRIGWKPQFNQNDRQVTRIMPIDVKTRRGI